VDEFENADIRAAEWDAAGARSLPPVEDGVSLWWSDLAPTEDWLARAAGWLSPAEQARNARFGTDALRRKYVAGRATLRLVLARALGVDPAAVPIRRGARGRPELAETGVVTDFNLSHTRGGAVIGIVHGQPATTRIGVDVEREDRSLASDGLARKFLTPSERASLDGLDADLRRRRFLRHWTCKEAMSKATGDGLAAPMRRMTIAVEPDLALLDGPAPYVSAAWRLHRIAVPPGFLATIAIWRARPPTP
jgi:4'-phosphopantetheinyl transferase